MLSDLNIFIDLLRQLQIGFLIKSWTFLTFGLPQISFEKINKEIWLKKNLSLYCYFNIWQVFFNLRILFTKLIIKRISANLDSINLMTSGRKILRPDSLNTV
ncbi:hypothetical protein BpHYR1_032222 [Brachionus plicatilis]|uniref:Uncharacterized protein n=1 Tax=Brachionus plicatilis TaxID=10195 RepID=A0A3M7RCA5_BRAPC|nr:hypothetical protein BpHYR1_032222 [Brachionus plicatilis]